MAIPVLFGRPVHLYFGILAALLLFMQIMGGCVMVKRGKGKYLRYHKFGAIILAIFSAIHIFIALKIYF